MEPGFSRLVGTFHPRMSQQLDQLQDRLLPIGPRVPSADELSGGYQVPGLGPVPHPTSFYPANIPNYPAMTTKVKTEGLEKGRLMYSGSGGGKAYSFSLGPEQMGGERWIEEIPLRMGLWMRDWLVKFVIDVSGVVGAVTPDELMLDPFADMKLALDSAAPRPMQLPTHSSDPGIMATDSNGVPINPMRAPVDQGTGFETQGFTEAIQTLEKLAKEVLRYGGGTDVLRVYDYLNQRQHGRDKAIIQWMTLPQNLGRLFLKPVMTSAVQICLGDVSQYTSTPDNGQLLGDLLASEAYTKFFEMVGTRILIARYDRRGGDKTKHEVDRLESRYRQRLSEIQEQGIVLAAPQVPSDSVDLSVQAVQSNRIEYDSMGRPITTIN
jgi:hypothetical protein